MPFVQFDGHGTGPENVIYGMIQPQDPPLTEVLETDPRWLAWLSLQAEIEVARESARQKMIQDEQTNAVIAKLVSGGVINQTQLTAMGVTSAPPLSETQIQPGS